MEIWTGVACLVADPKCEGFRRFGDNGKGAYVNVVASVASEAEFAERVERIVPTLDCVLLELNRVQPIEERMEEPDFPEELITSVPALRDNLETLYSEHFTYGLRARPTDWRSSLSTIERTCRITG